MKALLQAFFIYFLFSPGVLAEEFVAYTPDVSSEKRGAQKYYFDKKLVQSQTAKLISDSLVQNNRELTHPIVYQIPRETGMYLVMMNKEPKQSKNGAVTSDYGPCFVLVSFSGEKTKIIKITHGYADSYRLDPRFYVGKNTVIVLAEEGAEDYWGMSLYQYDRNKKVLKAYGALDAGKVIGIDDPVSPINDLRVFSGPPIEFRFYTDIVANVGSHNEKYLYRNNGYVSYLMKDGKAVLDNRDYSPSPSKN